MKAQEVIVRVIIETPRTGKSEATTNGKGSRHPYGKSMPKTVYPKVLALPVGGILDITEEVKGTGITLERAKGRIGSYVFWANKRDGESRAYMVARGEAGTIKVARTR
jgi:hypothetical protein